jgi:HSP20 family protein
MQITRYDPFREFEKRVASMFNPESQNSTDSNVTGFVPAVNSREDESSYHLSFDLPGVGKDNINLEIKDNILSVSGEKTTKNELKESDYYRLESYFGRFRRSFTLPENADGENIEAKMDNGVLEVTIPKAEKKNIKSIYIK